MVDLSTHLRFLRLNSTPIFFRFNLPSLYLMWLRLFLMYFCQADNLKKILDCLENETNEIILDSKTIEAARKSVIRMTEIGR